MALCTTTIGAPAIAQEPAATAQAKPKKRRPAPAQPAPAETAAPDVLPPVTATAVQGSDPFATPSAVSTVAQGSSRWQGDEKLDDILRMLPGTFTRQNGQQPGVAVNIRGFEGVGRVAMSIDGARQNFRFTGHEAGGFLYVEPLLLAGIEVDRGAVSTEGGAGALAGTADFRTIGFDDIVRDGKNWGFIAQSSLSSNGQQAAEMIGGAVRINDAIAITAAIAKRDANDYKNGDGVKQIGTGQDGISGLLKADLKLGDYQTLSLGGIFYNNDFFANSYYQTIKSNTGTLKYRFQPGNDLVDLKINAYVTQLDMDYDKNAAGGGSAANRTIEDFGWGGSISNTSRWDFGTFRLKSTYGVEYYADQVKSTNGGVNPGDGDAATGGVFSETTLSYGMFDLTGGLRYDFYKLSGSASNIVTGPYTVDRSEGQFDPKITLAATVLEGVQPYITYSHSFRAPTLEETMLGGDHPGSTISFVPNPDLEPEKQRGWEAGVNLRRDGIFTGDDSFRGKLSVFTMQVEDYVVSAPNAAYGGRYQYVNVPGTSRVQGVELEAHYDAGFAFADIAYTHNDSKLPLQTPGLGANQALPDDILGITVGARFLDRRVTVGTTYTYVSDGLTIVMLPPTFQPSAGTAKGYSLFDAFVDAKWNDNFSTTFKVANIADRTYTPSLSTFGSGMGRTFSLVSKLRF